MKEKVHIGTKIDEGYSLMLDNTHFKYLHQVLPLKFTYLYTSQLLECIKAELVIPRIKQHLDLGRKIVIFHSYNHSKPSHPFDFPYELYSSLPDSKQIQRELSLFNQLYPEYAELNLSNLTNPISTIKKAFGSKVGVFNGDVTKSERDYIIRKFNEDDSYKDILIVQVDAGKEGISLHDRTGKHQRVAMVLCLPTRPTTALQIEGRISRFGLRSNAAYEYMVLHTNFEKFAFADKISKRVRTAENLAVGSKARNLELSFKEGYLNPNSNPPSLLQGTGGKLNDNRKKGIDEWELALRHYETSKEKGRKETPEPIGLLMSRWLCANPNDELLNPFAGTGTIGRFFKENTINDYLEKDIDKRAVLAINVQRSNRILPYTILEHHIKNKYYGIAFNEPSKDYVEICYKRLKDTGRIVAITSGVGKMFQDNPTAVLRYEIYLPKLLGFKKIMIIDKVLNPLVRKFMPEPIKHSFVGVNNIEELFEELKQLNIEKRLVPEKKI